ncbi:unnamed protein product [Rotaria magnacalcarata]|uniref:Death domain-containing protein n=3 Tax=Rotaria magnacalcarata TaxID=392030 RepID=A0A816FKN7_9BILA|nr:unnamed protein product [Rotaria magnacalcarata]CAF1662904.1 unnamed protein product [Rotaria magnacalcarata]CAF2187843.1 unnamed protein product [Rotaria magnacalcarata]CAF4064254.1 unnamed protein product [Rotaria magnacalcarata]CAF4145291.1 unnamed protein product [Rotaria magnacalcarata]
MSARSLSSTKKANSTKVDSSSTKKKGKKKNPQEDIVDLHQQQIDELVREREEIRSKLNTICSKIIENTNIDDYQSEIDLTKQQPSDVPLDNILSMIDTLCHYRSAFLNIFQESEEQEHRPIQKRITQLAIEEPNLLRKRLTLDQRLTFVARERDLWKENAQSIQIMYATIVDQLEIGALKNSNSKTTDIIRSHRLNLEDVCLIFSSSNIRSLDEAQKQRKKNTLDNQLDKLNDKQISFDLERQDDNNNSNISSFRIPSTVDDDKTDNNSLSSNVKRTVLFATEVRIINDNEDISHQQIKNDDQSKTRLFSPKPILSLASHILIDNMDSDLRMLIIKELSKDNFYQRPPSKMSFNYTRNNDDFRSYQENYRSQNRLPEWVVLARLIGVDEPEIDHWSSQNLQYPAGRVISTWCNSTSPPPTVAQLYFLLSTNQLNRLDLARHIETMYRI